MPGGSSTTQTTQSSSRTQPWSPAVKPLKEVIGQIGTFGKDQSYFTPTRGADTSAALAGLRDVAASGSSAINPLTNLVDQSGSGFGIGMGELSATARGDRLNGNPFLANVLDRVAEDTANNVNQQFTAAGRYGSGAHSGTLAREIGRTRSEAMLDNYNRERGYQIGASENLQNTGFRGADAASALDQARLFAPGLQQQIGAQEDAYAQGVRNAPLTAAEWTAGQLKPIAALGQQSSGTQTATTETPSNPLGTAIGIGSTALGLLGTPFTGGASLGLLGGGAAGTSILGNLLSGAPAMFGNSWSPWVKRA